MEYEKLKGYVCQANKDIVSAGLVRLTFGNVSAIDRDKSIVAIKPSGVDYDVMNPEDVVVVSLEDGRVVDGALRPSSDTPTHLQLYRDFPEIGAVVHTHSTYATSWAQAGRAIPCLGTTHADHFYGPVLITRELTEEEILDSYESNTGKVVSETLHQAGLGPVEMSAVLVRNHGPFAWGLTLSKAVANAVAVEEVAKSAYCTLNINPDAQPIPDRLLKRHFFRKHGKEAYYGQNR